MSNATRTPQQAMADAIKSGAVQAWIDGKPIQVATIEHPDKWNILTHEAPHFVGVSFLWRPVPTPRLRPWTLKEIPVGAVIRQKKEYTESEFLIRAKWMCSIGRIVAEIDPHTQIYPETLAEQHEWKWPQEPETEWRPCGVQEGGE